MKNLDINVILNFYNAAVSGWVLLLTTLFGSHWYLFAAFLLFNVADWLTGWYKARKLQKEMLWSSIFVTLVAKKYQLLIKLPPLLHAG